MVRGVGSVGVCRFRGRCHHEIIHVGVLRDAVRQRLHQCFQYCLGVNRTFHRESEFYDCVWGGASLLGMRSLMEDWCLDVGLALKAARRLIIAARSSEQKKGRIAKTRLDQLRVATDKVSQGEQRNKSENRRSARREDRRPRKGRCAKFERGFVNRSRDIAFGEECRNITSTWTPTTLTAYITTSSNESSCADSFPSTLFRRVLKRSQITVFFYRFSVRALIVACHY